MVSLAHRVKFQVLDSELQALFVEAELIRTYQPEYNILLKDDKSPLYLHLSQDPYPELSQVRRQDIVTKHLSGTILGPFASGYQLKQALGYLRPIFGWCSHPNQTDLRPCFYRHLDQCFGACVRLVSPTEYRKNMRRLGLVLRGKSPLLLKELKRQMQQASKAQQYEAAAKLRDQLVRLSALVTQPQAMRPDLTLPLYGQRSANQLMYLRRLLRQYFSLPAQYSLERIEGYDVSNLQGKNAAVSQVVFTNGQKDLEQYRLYNIRSLDTPNDVGMLKEALLRRQNHPEWTLPNLVVIDGGRGQLRAAINAWQAPLPILSIAKNPDRLIFPMLDLQTKLVTGFHEVRLPSTHPAIQLIQALRDEAHRFSRAQHRKRRQRLPKL